MILRNGLDLLIFKNFVLQYTILFFLFRYICSLYITLNRRADSYFFVYVWK